jgi:hypothetical protein
MPRMKIKIPTDPIAIEGASNAEPVWILAPLVTVIASSVPKPLLLRLTPLSPCGRSGSRTRDRSRRPRRGVGGEGFLSEANATSNYRPSVRLKVFEVSRGLQPPAVRADNKAFA